MAEHSMCQPGKPTPQGLSHSIWRFWSRRAEFPQGEIGGIALLAHVDARVPACRPSMSRRRQGAVIRQLGGIEVDAVRGAVGEAFGLDAVDELDLFLDVVGCPAPDGRLEDIQPAADLPGKRGYKTRRSPRRSCRCGGSLFPSCLHRYRHPRSR